MRKVRRIIFLKLRRMFRGEKNIVPCIISTGTKIVGNIEEGDAVHIDGKLEGNICCKELVVGAGGEVKGNVSAKSVELYGELTGSLSADNLFIAGTARFIGDSIYKTIAIEPGAVLEGNCLQNKEAA